MDKEPEIDHPPGSSARIHPRPRQCMTVHFIKQGEDAGEPQDGIDVGSFRQFLQGSYPTTCFNCLFGLVWFGLFVEDMIYQTCILDPRR